MTPRIALIAFFALAAVSCQKDASAPTTSDTTDPAGAAAKVAQAYSAMEDQFSFWADNQFHNAGDYDRLTFAASNALYREAIALDPQNTEAHFGAAITEMLSAYADTQINSAVKRWETYLNTSHPLSSGLTNIGFPSSAWNATPPILQAAASVLAIQKAATQDAPLISEMQQLLKGRLLPRVEYGLQQLAIAESDTAFRFRISGKMQGDPHLQPVYMYATEICFVHAAWSGIRFMIEELLMYQFPLADYRTATVADALRQDNTTFYVLAPDGPQHAQHAKAALQNIFDEARKGIGYLETLSGGRSDAVVKLGNSGFKQRDLDSVKTYLQTALSSLSAPVDVVLRGADTDGNDYTISVNLGRYFDNPVSNPKAQFLPAYTVDTSGGGGIILRFTAQTYQDFTFPDPTFGGVFPGMTNTTLKRLLRIDRAFAYILSGSAQHEAYYPFPSPATVVLRTAARDYSTTLDQWGNFKFFITDANNVPFRVFTNYGSGEVELVGNHLLVIRAKTSEWASILIPQQPQGLAASTQASPLAVQLAWAPPSSFFYRIIQKGTGPSATPVDVDSLTYLATYTDYAVVAGQTYNYRIRTGSPAFCCWYGISLQPKDPSYSNIVTIVP